jgi:hypothetical protein
MRGLLRGQCLLGPAPSTWQAVSAANPRRLKVVTENAEALTEHCGSLIRFGACADEDCPIPDSTQGVPADQKAAVS